MITNATVELDIEALTLVVIIIITFIGSLSKDYIESFQFGRKIKFGRICLSTVTASIIVYSIEPYIISTIGFRGITIASFLFGLAGYETLEQISSLNKLLELIKLLLFNRGLSDYRNYQDVIKKADKENKDIKIILCDKSNEDNDDKPKKEVHHKPHGSKRK